MKQIGNERLSWFLFVGRLMLLPDWLIPSQDLQVNQASCFKLPAYLYATKQFTPLPQRSLLPSKALYDKYDDSILPCRHLYSAFFFQSHFSQRDESVCLLDWPFAVGLVWAEGNCKYLQLYLDFFFQKVRCLFIALGVFMPYLQLL